MKKKLFKVIKLSLLNIIKISSTFYILLTVIYKIKKKIFAQFIKF